VNQAPAASVATAPAPAATAASTAAADHGRSVTAPGQSNRPTPPPHR
jgi:hypothetical protein